MKHGRVRWLIDTAEETVTGFIDHQIMTQAAALAFYSALSLAPILVLLVWGAGSLGFDAQEDVVSELQQLLGTQAADAVATVMQDADDRPDIGRIAGWLSLGALAFSASAVFAQLQQAMNLIWGVAAEPSAGLWTWARKRLLSLGLVVSLGFTLLVSMVIGAVIEALSTYLEGRFPMLATLWPLIEFALPFLVYVAAFMLMIKVLPDRRLGWRDVFYGALVTAALFTVGKHFVGLYIAHRASESAYGAAGSLMAILLWTYYSSIIVLVGSELAAAAARARGDRVQLEEHAVES